VFFVKNATDTLVTKPLTGFAAYACHVESMSAIEELAHSFCNLLNVAHLDKQSSPPTYKIRDAADSG
jgi:hypothetical protein